MTRGSGDRARRGANGDEGAQIARGHEVLAARQRGAGLGFREGDGQRLTRWAGPRECLIGEAPVRLVELAGRGSPGVECLGVVAERDVTVQVGVVAAVGAGIDDLAQARRRDVDDLSAIAEALPQCFRDRADQGLDRGRGLAKD